MIELSALNLHNTQNIQYLRNTMRTLEQQQKQIRDLIPLLQRELGQLLAGHEDNQEIKKSIVLHCAMILLYQKLDALLQSVAFISFFDKNLKHLLYEGECFALFEQLIQPYHCDLPSDSNAQELFFMIKFTTVILLETQKKADNHEAHTKALQKTSFGTLVLSTFMFAACGWLSPEEPAFFPTLSVSFALLFISAISFALSQYSPKIEPQLRPFRYADNIEHLRMEIIDNKRVISPERDFVLPQSIPDFITLDKSKMDAIKAMVWSFYKPEKLDTIQCDIDTPLLQAGPIVGV